LTPAERRNVMASRKLAQERGMRVMQKQCASSVEEGSPPHRTQEQEKEPLPRVRLCDVARKHFAESRRASRATDLQVRAVRRGRDSGNEPAPIRGGQ